MPQVHLFLSTVSDEFRSYRDALRRLLTRPNVQVHIQEDFIATGTPALDKLDRYISICDAVIHLVGDMTGSFAPGTMARALSNQHPDLAERLPPLASAAERDDPPISYTQWEAYLALYHQKPLIIAIPEPGAPRSPTYQVDSHQQAAQQAHLARLREFDRYPDMTFGNIDQLSAKILRSAVFDILTKAAAPQQRRISSLIVGLAFLVSALLFSWASFELRSESALHALYLILALGFSAAAFITLYRDLKRRLPRRRG